MKLSIVVPCYNEGKSIKKNITKKVIPYLDENGFDYELILVDDGSKDNTKKQIESIEGVKAISYKPNRGKGGAVKEGILNASGDYVLFMDADLSTDLSAFNYIKEYMGEYDFIIGSRHVKGSKIVIKQPLHRQFIGYMCRKLVNANFKFNYKDTQCGFKAIKTSIAKEIATRQIINGFAFDVEYLYFAKINKLTTIEIPVIWENDRSSTVIVTSSSIRFYKDLKVIKKNKKKYMLLREYE